MRGGKSSKQRKRYSQREEKKGTHIASFSRKRRKKRLIYTS